MRKPWYIMFIGLTALLLSSALLAPAPAQAADCQFILGFKALRDQIPDLVGDCLENEWHNPTNGNTEQRTTAHHGKGGLLVWRKADNWTAFTDGAWTWVNGPYGIQKRLNTERFPWEQDRSGLSTATGKAVPHCDEREPELTLKGRTPTADGALVITGTVRNTCERTVHVTLDWFAALQNGQRYVDAPTVFVWDLAPGAVRDVSVRIPLGTSGVQWPYTIGWLSDAEAQDFCMDVGTTRCLNADPRLYSSLQTLRGVEGGEWLLRVAAEQGVRVHRERMSRDGVLGYYRPSTRNMAISEKLDSYSSYVRAVVLAHELQHAADHAAGKLVPTSASCLAGEASAFKRAAEVWTGLWQNQLPPNVDSLHQELNAIAVVAYKDPEVLARALAKSYHEQCS